MACTAGKRNKVIDFFYIVGGNEVKFMNAVDLCVGMKASLSRRMPIFTTICFHICRAIQRQEIGTFQFIFRADTQDIELGV